MRLHQAAPVVAFLLSSPISITANLQFDHKPDEICLADCQGDGTDRVCTFEFSINAHASELGYYMVKGCNGIMPVLGMEKGVHYVFSQKDSTNYYHPLGLAYEADGAHADVAELEPVIAPPGTQNSCADNNDMRCPAPMYMLNSDYLGVYSNNENIAPATSDADFGLDVYEPQFFVNFADWVGAGTYEVSLKFDDDDFIEDIFYFCHIHQFMTGRIKFVNDQGAALNNANLPVIPYSYENASPYDQGCGTFGLADFQLPNGECAEEYVCNQPSSGGIANFSKCIESMNCRMTTGMTTRSIDSPIALFNYMMIPHHQNAVNMAKALLRSGDLDCDDQTAEDLSTDCIMNQLAMEIIGTQNHQIQSMRNVLDDLKFAPTNDCELEFHHIHQHI